MTISAPSSKLKMNRNLMARYLEMLLISGQVRMDSIGNAKVYSLSHRVPISAMLEFSSDLVIMPDSENKILQVNEPLLQLLDVDRESLIGKRLEETNNAFLRDVPVGVAGENLLELIITLSIHRREGEVEGRAHIRFRLHPHVASVPFDILFASPSPEIIGEYFRPDWTVIHGLDN